MIDWKDTVFPSSCTEQHALLHADTRFYVLLTKPACASERYADPELLHE